VLYKEESHGTPCQREPLMKVPMDRMLVRLFLPSWSQTWRCSRPPEARPASLQRKISHSPDPTSAKVGDVPNTPCIPTSLTMGSYVQYWGHVSLGSSSMGLKRVMASDAVFSKGVQKGTVGLQQEP
jgi:hypothetical protein